jgi:hypothetical protein
LILGSRYLYPSLPFVHTSHLHGDHGLSRQPEEAHLDPDVLFAVGLVDENVVDLANLLARVVVNRVVFVLVVELLQTIVSAHDTLLLSILGEIPLSTPPMCIQVWTAKTTLRKLLCV